jgi:hypothetical protein
MDCQSKIVKKLYEYVERLTGKLSPKARYWFYRLLISVLLAVGMRRTVTKWIQGAALSEHFKTIFYHLQQVGMHDLKLYGANLEILLDILRSLLESAKSIQLIVDDTPTKRYGRHIEGCGTHHNPTPGKTDAEFYWGHSWVVVCLVVTHPLWGSICFPIIADLYIQEKIIEVLRGKYKLQFETKMQKLVKMIEHLLPYFKEFEQRIEVIVDGGYANKSAVYPLTQMNNITVITRLRHDARLFELPPKRQKGQRGRPRVKGDLINVKSKSGCSRGWQSDDCFLYGKVVTKHYKTFIAVSELTSWQSVRVVLVQEDDGKYVLLMGTDIRMSAKEILESYGCRFGIEEMFKDLKEVECWGKQEVRNLWSNIAVTAINLVMFCATEMLCWDISSSEIVDRSTRPWDSQSRRPSHRDKHNYLKIQLLQNELNTLLRNNTKPQKIIEHLKYWLNTT